MAKRNVKELPIIYLTYANHYDGRDFLPELQEEARESKEALVLATEMGLCELIFEPQVRLEDIFDTFQKKGDRIVLFHFAGHAGADKLFLESDSERTEIAHSEGLLSFLQRQKGLKCIFLNGCSSATQTRSLQASGIPFVIGTIKEINDRVASQLAIRFYKGIGLGWSLERSWKDAESIILTKHGSRTRELYLSDNNSNSQNPWEQLTLKGAEVINDWNLPAVSRNFLFGLPSLQGHYAPPEIPYRFLERYQRSDTVVFFGRDRYIQNLFHRITDGQSAPVIMLTGQSGVGKSSLIEAGLIPRLESSHNLEVIRCSDQISLLDTLKQALGVDKVNPTQDDFLAQWKRLEIEKPFVIILDQLEVVFRKSKETEIKELKEFLKVIGYLFSSNASKLKGKLILSYRKEYDAELDVALSQACIPLEKVFLEPLNEEEISEIVKGLTSSTALKRKYRLEVEDGLAPILSHDLLSSQDSPIAPTLQVILTKMWEVQLKRNVSKRAFTLEDYEHLKKNGIFLKDFFKAQMKTLENWADSIPSDVESSGLAIDILNLHTSSLRTSQSCKLDDLQILYQHRIEVLQDLITKFIELNLLRKLDGNEEDVMYSLAHDTLAPIVQKEFEQSSHIGQQAFRVLTTKTDVFKHKKDIFLDDEDLALVEKGACGMRFWTNQEKALIEQSRERRAKRIAEKEANELTKIKSKLRQKNGLRIISGLVSLLAIVVVWFSISTYKQSQVNSLISQALQEEKLDATKAFKTIQKALSISSDHETGIQARHDIYSFNEFYDTSLFLESPVVDLNVMGDRNILAASGNSLKYLDKTGRLIWEKEQDSEVLSIDISANGEQILMTGKEGIVKILDLKGDVIHKMTEHQDWVGSAIFLSDANHILSGDRNGNIILWDRSTGTIQKVGEHEDEIQDLVYSAAKEKFISVSWDGKVRLSSLTTNKFTELPIDGRGLTAAFSNDGNQIVVGDRSGAIYFFNSTGQTSFKVLAHKFRINNLQFSPDGKMLLSASDDKTIKLWDRGGNLLSTYKGHEDYVHCISFDELEGVFYSGSEDQTIKRWRIESKVSHFFGNHKNEVSALALSADLSILVSGSGSGNQTLFNSSNDLNTDFDFDFEKGLQDNGQTAYIWNINESESPIELKGHNGAITSVAINQKAGLILTGSDDASARFWDLEGNPHPAIIKHEAGVYDVALSKNGKWFATSAYDSLIILGNTETFLDDTIHLKYPSAVERIAFSPNHLFLLSGHADSNVILWNLKGEEIKRFSKNRGSISAMAFSPKGNIFLVGDSKNAAVLYDINIDEYSTFKLSDKTKTGAEGVLAVAFSPKGNLVAMAGIGGVVEIVDLEGNKYWKINNLDSSPIFSLAMGQDEIYTGGAEGVIREYKLRLDK